ncbi:hypothetical protein XCR_1511 [Xanthomonas campestris pv. raphani 756C]|nr:hypothetical protein XCR_1511 [Xanthomonas campestris pv. raphani 756C]
MPADRAGGVVNRHLLIPPRTKRPNRNEAGHGVAGWRETRG